MKFVRVLAGDIIAGDRVARTRTANFHTVESVQGNAETVWITYSDCGGRDRPRKSAKWWKDPEAQADHV